MPLYPQLANRLAPQQMLATAQGMTPTASTSAPNSYWGGYLDANPDVRQFYDANTNNIQSEVNSPEAWAKRHYAESGQAEGRMMQPATSGGFWDSNPYDGPPDPQLAAPSMPSVQTGGGQYDLASVSGEGFMRPWTEAFQERTPEQMRGDPAYQFRLGEGEQAIERSAAAKGTLLSGSTLKDLMSWGQGLASEEFDKMYNRDLGQYRQAFDIYNTNTNNQFNRMSSLAGLGQNANSQNLSAGLNFGANAGNNIMGAGNAIGAGQAAGGAAYGGALGQLGNIGSDAWMRYANSRPQPYGGSFGTAQLQGMGITAPQYAQMMPQAPPSAGYAGGVP